MSASAAAASAGGEAFAFRWPVDVRFRDLDAMGHAHHSLLLIYIEEARAAYWRELTGRGDVAAIEYVLGEVTLRFHQRIFYPLRLDVGVRISRVGTSSFDIEYEVRDGRGELLASAVTKQIMYDYAAASPMPVPDELRRRMLK